MLRSDKTSAGGALQGKKLPKSHTDKPTKGEAAKIRAESKQVLSNKQWENSATDAAKDRKVAKQNGMSLKQYEGSKLDEKNDAKQRAAHNAAARKKGGK
jgi:hypothetical protein